MEHELSAEYDIAHRAGLAIVFSAWMKYVYRGKIHRFVQFAVRVWDVDFTYEHPEEIILEGIRRMEKFFRSIGIPVRLSKIGIGEERLEQMAEKPVYLAASGDLKSFRNRILSKFSG